MRIIAVCALALMLVGCVTTEEQQRLDAAAQESKECALRETIAVAKKSIDLETATLAVMALCQYPDAIEKSIAAKYGSGYRGAVHKGFERVDFKEMIKRDIALLRAQAR
jgi:hypothetical protein